MTPRELSERADAINLALPGLKVGDAMVVVEYADLGLAYLARGQLDAAETALEIAEIEAERIRNEPDPGGGTSSMPAAALRNGRESR